MGMAAEQGGTESSAPATESGVFDVDSFMSNLDNADTSLPSDRDGAPAITEPPKAPAAPAVQEIEFTYGGQQIKAPFNDPRVKQWASQGYDYNQRMAAFKSEQEAFAKQRAELDPIKARYSDLEAFAEQNPGWIDHVNAAWEQARAKAGQSADLPPAVASKLSALEAQLSDVMKFKTDSETQRVQQQTEQEDQTLNREIQSLRDIHKDLDWNTVSPDGHALDKQVLKFMQDNHIGIKRDGSYVPGSFERAFKAFNHDQLVKRAEERGKENVVKARQKETKLGLLGQSSTPKKGITYAEDRSNKSMNDLALEAIEELGLGA